MKLVEVKPEESWMHEHRQCKSCRYSSRRGRRCRSETAKSWADLPRPRLSGRKDTWSHQVKSISRPVLNLYRCLRCVMSTQLSCYPVQTRDFLSADGSAARGHSWLREEPEDLLNGGLPSCCLPLALAQPHSLLSGSHLTVKTTKEETGIQCFLQV